jgi:N6-adenosine-specific RNA methylase IME4
MTELVHYDAARTALAEAQRVDDVLEIRNRARALELYAQQAKDTELMERAVEIKLRAERRMGELLTQMRDEGTRQGRGRPKKCSNDETFSPPDTLDKMEISRVDAHRWMKISSLTDPEFSKRITEASKAAVAAAEMSRAEKTEAKKDRRAEREQSLAIKQRALPDEKYGVIYLDPPWRYEDRSADNHYPTMTLEELSELKVENLAADDCVMFMWATAPFLRAAILLMHEYGFTYKSHLVWTKDKIGTGYWFRSKHEVLLVGTRGDVPAPAPGDQWESVLQSPVREHSAKPEDVMDMIEAYFPTMPKVELFAYHGKRRAGWDYWGLHADVEA